MSERDDLLAQLEAMGDAVLALPSVASDAVTGAKQRSQVSTQEGGAYGDEPALSWVDRATASIPIAGQRKLGFLKKRFGNDNVNVLPSGEVAITGPDGKARLADPKMTMKELVVAATAPMSLPAIAVLESVAPGATGEWGKAAKELVGDVADAGTDIGEAAIQAGAETLGLRGGGGGVKAMAKGGLAGGLGGVVSSIARWGASQAVPSDQPEISFTNALRRGATNAAVSVPASALGGVAAVGRTPWSKADPSIVERATARELFGEMRGPTVDAGRRIESAIGARFMPDAMNKNLSAVGSMNTLRQAPGSGELFMTGETIPNAQALSGFLNKRMDALVASGLPAVDAGEKMGGDLVRFYGDIDKARKGNFSSGMEQISAQPLPGPIVPNKTGLSRSNATVGTTPIASSNEMAVRDQWLRKGVDLGDVPSHQSLEELQAKLSDYGTRAYGGGRAAMDRTVDQAVSAQMKEAIFNDIEAGLPKSVVKDFKAVRAQYAVDSEPLKSADTEAVKHILNLNEKMGFEHIPKALLTADQRPRQIALAVMDKANPASAAITRRAAVDAALEDAVATGSSLEGSRLKDVAEQTGETLYTSGLAAKGLRDNRAALLDVLGKNSEAAKDLDMVIEGFERMDLATKGAKGSQTGRMKMIDDTLKALSGVILHPVETASTMSLYVYRNRWARMLLDDRQRGLLLGVTHAAADTPARVITSNAARLSAMLAREETPEEPVK